MFYKKPAGIKEYSEKVFRSICEPVLPGNDITGFFTRVKTYILARIIEYERNGSGWIFDSHKSSHLHVAKYNPLRGAGHVKIPEKVKKMKSVLNIESPDDRCFLYCLLAKLYPVQTNPARYTKYLDHISSIDMVSVQFPVNYKQIHKVEAINNLSISVFGWDTEEGCAVPIKHGSGSGTVVDLLYINDDGQNGHYMLIKNFDSFMNYRSKHRSPMHHCRKCLHGFTTKQLLASHFEACNQGVNQVVTMPPPGHIEFKAIHKKEKKLFTLYFDFETILLPIQGCQRSPDTSYTEPYQKHVPCSFSIVTTSEFPNFKEEVIDFANPNPQEVIKQFIAHLDRIYKSMMECYETNQHPIHMTNEDWKKYRSSTTCHICGKPLEWSSKKNYTVKDHNHLLQYNNFRGAAHNICNRNYFERTKKVAAICHNNKGYDMHLYLTDLIKAENKVEVIPENINKFKVLITERFIFLDSFAFLSTSLENLVKSVKAEDKLERMKKEFPEHYEILSEKGVYFYDYVDSFSVFEETQLPPREAFYSRLKQQGISEQAHERAQQVFSDTGCKTLLEYMLLYVRTDAVQLCDVFEHFRNTCMSYYFLDPCQYFSLPALSWDAMLLRSKVKLEYITDHDMYTFLEENIRGGVTTINHRHFKANNEYLDDYDSSQPTSFIHYIDMNNLYGAGMSEKLPTGEFRWLTEQEVEQFEPLMVDADGEKCYILQVDLHYPPILHDTHSDYPLAVEKKSIDEEDLSPYNKSFLSKHNKKFIMSTKLVPDLKDKHKYVCSLKNLQLFLKQGLVLKKIYRVLEAHQSDFLREYIEFNTGKRQEATSKFEQDMFKLFCNAIYGKTIEDLRKRTNIEVVKEKKRAMKLTSKPQFKTFHILDKDVSLVQTSKTKLVLNKPIYCGFMVLEHSKYMMSNFWYTVLKPKYGDRIKLILSDTDSIIYGVYTQDGYKDLYDIREHNMDLSGYDKNTTLGKFHDTSKRKVPGYFSDERPTEILREVIALKPKMYSIETQKLLCSNKYPHDCSPACFSGHSITAKGIPKKAQENIRHEEYREVLTQQSTTSITASSIRTVHHQIFTVDISKLGLSPYDDKKYIEDNGISTLSYGHWRIPKTCGLL